MDGTTNGNNPHLVLAWLEALTLTMAYGFVTQHRTGHVAGQVPTPCCVFAQITLWYAKLIVNLTLWTLTTSLSVC